MKKDIVRDSAITRLTENVDWRTCVRITRERLEAHKTRKSGARTYWERGDMLAYVPVFVPSGAGL